MDKTAIDKELPKIYPLLLETAKRMCWKYKRTYSPGDIVNNAYLYIIQIKHKIDDPDMLRRYMSAQICQEIALSQSKTNYKKRNVQQCDLDENISIEYDEYFDPYEEEVKALEQYRTIPDRVKRRVFEVYFDLGQNSCRKMAVYFDIDTKSAMNLIREMKADLQQIAEQ